MNAATEFDLGPLTWVKGEIDQALGRAEEALAEYVATADATQLKFCRTHVHQVHGALDIVGLNGITELSESIEAALLALEEGGLAEPATAPTVVREALGALRQYLDDLIAGEPHRPLRMLPTCARLAELRGLPPVHPGDLFYPDLSLRPPRSTLVPPTLAPDETRKVLRKQRMRFQKGLLKWLTEPEQRPAGRAAMAEALAAIEAIQPTPGARSFWWVSQAFLEALDDPEVSADHLARQLCARIDLQIRRLLEGSGNLAERVMREALYYVARTPAQPDSLIAQAQQIFDLPAQLPATAPVQTLPKAQEQALRRLRELLVGIEEVWNKYCAGSPASLATFAEQARACAQVTGELGHTDLKRLGQALAAIAGWLQEDAGRFNDGVAMEVATAILLLQNAHENFRRLGGDFAQQVDLMVDRIHASIAGRPAAGGDVPLLDEMTRRAQERLLIAQVGREIQNNLAQIEQTLDAFFRNPAKGFEMPLLEAPLKQISGALAMLGHFSAVNSLKRTISRIEAFAVPDYQPVDGDFQGVADELSLLGFFIDSLQHGETSFDAFVRRMNGDEAGAAALRQEALSVEAELAQQARETRALAEALRETPDDARLQDELKQNLEAIQKDADLVADRELGESAKAVLAALESGEQVDVALSGLRVPQVEAPQPSAATLQLAGSSHEEIDAELLAIFIEEGHEVLAEMALQKERLAADAHDLEALTTIRRCTHTLKGSGRMVGLVDFGETAWAVEQTLNLWLRQDLAVTPELLALIDAEHALFSAWVEQLASGSGTAPDAGALIALAASLRGQGEAAEAPLPAAVPTPVTAEALSAPAQASVAEVAAASVDDGFPELEGGFELDLPELATEPSVAEVQPADEASVADEAPADGAAPQTLYDIFRDEARGHLQTLVDSFAELEHAPAQPTTFEMTRAAHTLGGIAATVGLMPLNHLAIALEHALLRRDGAAQPDSVEGLETVRQAILTLAEMFNGLVDQQAPEEQPQLIAGLDEVYPPAPVADAPAASGDGEGGARIIPLPGLKPFEAVIDELPPAAEPPRQLTDELDEQLLPIFLEEAADQVRELTEQLRAWRAAPDDGAPAQAIARLLHTFKGNARMAGAMNLGEATHLLEARVQEALRAGSASAALIDEVEAGCDALALAAEHLRSGPPEAPPAVAAAVVSEAPAAAVPAATPLAEPESEAEGQRAMLRVRADLIDRLVNEAGELSIARARIEGEMRSLKTSLLDLTENVIRLRRQLREIEIQAEGQIQARVAQAHDGQAEFDPLELDRFTRFQELTRFMAESVNDVATVQQNLLKNLDDANAAILAQARLNRGLQQELMGVRMLPFASQAERLYRIVRQTAKEVGKRTNFDIVGGQVEIDRSVLEKIMAPIEHMLRNAVSHGIEAREQRLAADKPETGEIVLRLAQEANEIILSLSDDGRGLDRERIRARAVELGLLPAEQSVSDAALFDFIFQPGFSTATELSQVAGRGVGMDVVKTAVAALGGRIEIVSENGQGTTFRLYLPLTLAVTQTLLVRVGSQLYAVPSTMIEQVLELKEKGLAAIRDAGEAEWQGHRYPFHFLPHLLGDAGALPEAHRQYWVLLLRSGSQRVAVLVDELRGNQEVVVKNIGAQLARVVGIAGATVLGDGQVVLILNPVALASRGSQSATVNAPVVPVEAAAAPVIAHLPTVMVVDDSLTVRKITSRLLLREGYQVVVAKDGVDALEHLIDALPDVILSDIEMPRMDGFDFVRNLRADERLRDIPVIMITSRTADKHRNYALEIGANHYLGKPYDEDELLGLLAGYCGKTG
ncbi:hybrid sensor histidine kinase/response regulator [Azonexus fungiphilus]|uniref:hybrid sensor histidine kinase/response regulator n=1 Tax=Azonexus fungiphilus TaxID=146940 RepID=UPI00156BAB90|nr:Hpt domain-containing protein [Azonexus fungiphilus]NHC07820.1 response regulator [Azonexus fungiphilus]